MHSVNETIDGLNLAWGSVLKSPKYRIYSATEIEALVKDGILAQSDVDMLGSLRKTRNSLVHGTSDVSSPEDFIHLVAAIRVLKSKLDIAPRVMTFEQT